MFLKNTAKIKVTNMRGGTWWTKWRCIVICLPLLIHCGSSFAQAAPSLNLGSATGTPGTTVTIPVNLTNVDGTTIAAVGIDIGYDTSKFETPTAAIGPVGSAADKMLTQS